MNWRHALQSQDRVPITCVLWGWTRLSAALQENDDIRQEHDSQTQWAELAEALLAALKDRTGEESPTRLRGIPTHSPI